LIAATLAAVPAARAEVVDRIIAVVNNEVITQREVDRVLAPIYEQYRGLYYGDELVRKLEEARRGVVEELIEDKLILSEAKRLNIEVDDKEVEGRINDVAKRFKTKNEFEKALQQQGLTSRELKARYREQIMSRRLVDQKIGSRITISPVEVGNYYASHANEYIQPEEIKLSNILIRPRKDLEPAKALELAKEISNRIQEGGSFALLAKEYSEGPNASEGGSMGYVKKGDLLPEIEAVVFTLNEGEVSSILQTGLGYHIFRVEEKKERRVKELSEVRHEVEEAIFREKIRGRLKDWIENLKKNAYIAFK
jgi:parvulin-like peptidyl-prolyl isomerase